MSSARYNFISEGITTPHFYLLAYGWKVGVVNFLQFYLLNLANELNENLHQIYGISSTWYVFKR